MIDFKGLDATDFERFCWKLLRQLRFEKLNWRKGTGLSGSPADSGRDIEAYYSRKDVDGKRHTEHWFIECTISGVSTSQLSAALASAEAKRPDVLLIICSGFLSNPAKDLLESRMVGCSFPVRMKVWEQPDLDRLTEGLHEIKRRFVLEVDVSVLGQAHTNHLLYFLKSELNSIERFI